MKLAIFTTHPIQYQAPWFRALAASGLEVRVFFSRIPAATEQGTGFGAAFAWDIPLLDGYEHTVLGERVLPGFMPRFIRRPARGIGKALDAFRPDAVMILGWQEVSLLQVLLACRSRGLPVILRGESNARRRRPALARLLHRMIVSSCEAFLAIGQSNADFYREAGAADGRIFMAPYFVDNDRFAGDAAAVRAERPGLRKQWGVTEPATVFIFAGKLEEKKRILHFLDGLKRARDGGAKVHGLVVGSGDQQADAEAFVAAQGLPVTFAGFLNQSQIARAYAAADVLVLPSDYGETWGLVVNEAMATGLPVIVSDRPGSANDLVVPGQTGEVFLFGDTEALGAHMARLAGDPALRRKMGEAAQERVSAGYSIAVAVAQTWAALKAVARS